MKNYELIKTTYQLDDFMRKIKVPKETKIKSMIGYLSESVIFEGDLDCWQDRLDLLIRLLEKQTYSYHDMLEQ